MVDGKGLLLHRMHGSLQTGKEEQPRHKIGITQFYVKEIGVRITVGNLFPEAFLQILDGRVEWIGKCAYGGLDPVHQKSYAPVINALEPYGSDQYAHPVHRSNYIDPFSAAVNLKGLMKGVY
jgi:hypothetical protein